MRQDERLRRVAEIVARTEGIGVDYGQFYFASLGPRAADDLPGRKAPLGQRRVFGCTR